jgi:hypothetical protein
MAALLYLAFVKNAAKNITGIYQKILKMLRPKHYHLDKEAKRKEPLTSYYKGFKKFRENPDC